MANLFPSQKNQTLSHMNTDHRRDLRHIFLYYYRPSPSTPDATTTASDLLPASAPDPLMVDIDLKSITVRLPGPDTTHVIPLDPPLRAWEDRRHRLVGMTLNARQKLGVLEKEEGEVKVVVREYAPPRWPYDGVIFVAVLVYYFMCILLRAGYCEEGGLVGQVVEMVRFPGGLDGFRWVVKTIFVPVLGIHLTETWWLVRTRLSRFGVRANSRVWWLWVGSVFIEGAMAFKRFDLLVERLRGQKRMEREANWAMENLDR